jgi:hypothetical protein
METLEQKYTSLTLTPSDINEHLPTLKKYSEECDHITEMGVRWIVSTYAFLMGKPKTLISIDIQSPTTWGASLNPVQVYALEEDINFKFILGNTLEIEIEQTDLLFIDTWHAYKQLKSELALHHSKVNKYVILHDTTNFEFHDEDSYEAWGWKGENKGIWPAVEEFLQENSEWILHERFTNNNGLTILKRK